MEQKKEALSLLTATCFYVPSSVQLTLHNSTTSVATHSRFSLAIPHFGHFVQSIDANCGLATTQRVA